MRSVGTWLTLVCLLLTQTLMGQQVAQLLLCERVIDNEPLGVRESFQEDEKAYVWLKITEIEPSQHSVKVIWTLEGEPQHVEQLRISSTSWRTHCYKTVYKPGEWGVIVLGTEGDTLASRYFQAHGLGTGLPPLGTDSKLLSELPPTPVGGTPPAQLTFPPQFAAEVSQSSVVLPPSGGDSAQPQSVIVVFPGIQRSAISQWQQWLKEQSGNDPEGLEHGIRQNSIVVLLPDEGSMGDDEWEAMPAAIYRYENRLFSDLSRLRERYPLAADHVVLFGEGWGADIAWAIGQRYPDQFAGAWLRDCKCSYYQQGSLQVQAGEDMRYVLERDTLSDPESLEMLEQSLRQLARSRVSMQVWQQAQDAQERSISLRQTLGYLLAPNRER